MHIRYTVDSILDAYEARKLSKRRAVRLLIIWGSMTRSEAKDLVDLMDL